MVVAVVVALLLLQWEQQQRCASVVVVEVGVVVVQWMVLQRSLQEKRAQHACHDLDALTVGQLQISAAADGERWPCNYTDVVVAAVAGLVAERKGERSLKEVAAVAAVVACSLLYRYSETIHFHHHHHH